MSAEPHPLISALPGSGLGASGPADPPVPAMPLLRLRDLWAPRGPLAYPFGEPGVTRWYNARAAIWQGLRSLGLGPGDRVIAPAYTCGSELDTLVQAGLRLDFYRIRDDLGADLDDLERLCVTPAAAIFVTHFYGLPQPIAQIAELAARHGMRLIEDVSHGWGSCTPDGQPLGSFGEMAVFSLWKSLPVPDGGVLRLHPDAVVVPLPVRGDRPGAASMAGRLRHMLEETLATQLPVAVRTMRRRVSEPLVNGLKRLLPARAAAAQSTLETDSSLPPEAAQIAFRHERRAWRMTALSAHLLARLSRDDLVARRRANYQCIAERLQPGEAATPLLTSLPPGTSPLFFPLVVAEPRAFCRHLAAHRVGFFRGWCIYHPHVDWSRFPLESHLKEHVVVVPVHQGLSDADLSHIARAINVWNRRMLNGSPRP